MPSDDPIAIARLAVHKGLVTEEQLREAATVSAERSYERLMKGDTKPGAHIVDILIEKGYISPSKLRELVQSVKNPDASQVKTARRDSSGAAPSVEADPESTRKQPSPVRKPSSAARPSVEQDESTKKSQNPLKPPSSGASASVSAGTSPSRAGKKSFGKYMLVRELGKGGMSVVWEAYDTDLRRRVAVKFLTGYSSSQGYVDASQEQILKRFYREAHSAAKLNHPNVVKVFEVSELDGQHYIAMQYVEGNTLADRMAQGTAPMTDAVRILRDSALGVEHAHANGILHRDLKPHNVMVDGEGHAFVMDFGLARDLRESERLTISGISVGTPSYMPPEHAQGSKNEMDVRSDVYSLGAVLYEVLTGKPPFTGATPMEVMMAVVNTDPLPPRKVKASVPPELEAVSLKAIQKDKGRRYASAREFADELTRWLNGEPVKARASSLISRVGRKAARHGALWAGVSIAVISIASVAGWMAWTAKKERDHRADLLARADGHAAKAEWAAALELYRELGHADGLRRCEERIQADEEAKRKAERLRTADEKARRAKERYDARDWDGAAAGYAEALELNPEQMDALHYRGHIHLEKHRYDEALADWKRGLEIDPANYELLRDVSKVYTARQDLKTAKEYLEKSLRANPRFTDGHHELGHLLMALNEHAGAAAAFGEAIRLRPAAEYYMDRSEARMQVYHTGGHVDQPLIEAAITDATAALASSRSPRAYYIRARCHMEKHAYEKVIADCEEALKLAPPDPSRIRELLKKAQEGKGHHHP